MTIQNQFYRITHPTSHLHRFKIGQLAKPMRAKEHSAHMGISLNSNLLQTGRGYTQTFILTS